jgi:YD repeat-containing protein
MSRRFRIACAGIGALSAATISSSALAQAQSTYTYDALGRLTSQQDSTSSVVTYSYDKAGNRTQVGASTPFNGPISANNDAVSTSASTAVTFDPRVNDAAASGYALTISSISTPSHGTATFTGGSVTYTPSYGWTGTDSFTYNVIDNAGDTAYATITVTVSGSSAPPSAVNDTIAATKNTAVTFDPRANDKDPNNLGITIQSAGINGASGSHSNLGVSGQGTLPQYGAISVTSTSITYTPPSNWTGVDSFPYTIVDSAGRTSTAQVAVTVSPPTGPVAQPDSMELDYTVASGTNVTPAGAINPLSNDSSPLGYTLTVTAVTQPARGTVLFSNNSVSYTYYKSVKANANGYSDTDSFTYTISDGHGGTATATINVDINVGTNQ